MLISSRSIFKIYVPSNEKFLLSHVLPLVKDDLESPMQFKFTNSGSFRDDLRFDAEGDKCVLLSVSLTFVCYLILYRTRGDFKIHLPYVQTVKYKGRMHSLATSANHLETINRVIQT